MISARSSGSYRGLHGVPETAELLPFGHLEPVSLTASPFTGYEPEERHNTLRALASVDRDCHVLGSNATREVGTDLSGGWTVRRHDVLAMETDDLGARSGPVVAETPDSRAGLTVLQRE